MPQSYLDQRFPPIVKGWISEIYPWIGLGKDHLSYLGYWIRRFSKLRSHNESADRIIGVFLNCPNIYLLDSGRSAILIALQALGLKPGEEVLLSAFNCPAVAEAITQAGGIIKFVDINADAGLNLDSIKNVVGAKTKGLIVAHTYGLIDDLENLSSFCRIQGLFLINDLAQTLENPDSENKLNIYGDVSIYSFGPEKHLFALGGGALVTHRNDLIAQIENNLPKEAVSDHSLFLVLAERWKYYFTFFASKYFKFIGPLLKRLGLIFSFTSVKTIQLSTQLIKPRLMHPVQKSILARKLESYNVYLAKTIENFNQIKNKLKVPLLYSNRILPLYATLRVDAQSRYELAKYLANRGIPTVWNYLPLYKVGSLSSAELPATEKLWPEVLSIPFRYPMTIERINEICRIINSNRENADPRD